MQGVFIRAIAPDVESFEVLVDNHKAGVYVIVGEQVSGQTISPIYRRVMTGEQAEEYLKQQTEFAIMGLGWRPEPIVLMEDLFGPQDAESSSYEDAEDFPAFWCFMRAATKAELRAALKEVPDSIILEALSPSDVEGPLSRLPHELYDVAGPNPKHSYSWRGWFSWSERTGKWILK